MEYTIIVVYMTVGEISKTLEQIDQVDEYIVSRLSTRPVKITHNYRYLFP